jgi:hypothetical protein
MQQQSTTLSLPEPTSATAILDLVRQACQKTRTAARIAQSFENPSDVDFADLDAIGRNCYTATAALEAIEQLLAVEQKGEA